MPKIHEKSIASIQKNWDKDKIVKQVSNSMRKKDYPTISSTTRGLKRVLEIKDQVAWVEPGITMEDLVKATLHYGLVPEVVPEFKGITVGGAINGAALESSSHLYGQFNDTCISYELMVGDGSIIWANEKEHSELFYAIAGSYGTLGALLSVKLRLIPAARYVKLHYHHCTLSDVFPYLVKQHLAKVDFLEAIVYDNDHVVVISGVMTNDTSHYPVISLATHWSPWFYSHAKDTHVEECIPIFDYLFRHDRGAFWMGGFAPDLRMSLSYLAHKASLWFGMEGDFSEKFLPERCIPKDPGIFFRSLFGWLMGSKQLYASLHGGSEDWFEQKFAIQDFYLPLATAEPFTRHALEKYHIQPIWICPILSTTTPQIFSPHLRKQKELLFDIGIYGLPASTSGPKAVQDLEQITTKLDGRKMFYCHTYLTEDEFWKLYPKSDYLSLRERYQFEKLSPEITKKVLK